MSDNLETGPQSIDALLDTMYSEPEAPTEVEEQAAPDVEEDQADVEEIQAEAEEDQEEIDEATDPEPESEEPQHLSLDDYGDLTVPIVVDGVETKVNLKEAVKGYQLQADYSRKTAALAAERKQMEDALQQERAVIADQKRLLDEQLAQNSEPEPDWEKMARENPLEYLPAREKWNKAKADREQAQARLQQSQAAQSREFQAKTAEIAVNAMPEWATEGGFAANADARRSAALAAGFTETEYDSAVDFRLAVILEKASRYDAMKTKNTAVEKKLSKVPKVLKPGRSKGKADVQVERKAAINRKLTRPHSIDDALDAYMERQTG